MPRWNHVPSSQPPAVGYEMWTIGSNVNHLTAQGTSSGTLTAWTRIGTASNWVWTHQTMGPMRVALDVDGVAYAWGSNDYGGTGQGVTSGHTTVPTPLDGDVWVDVSAGYWCTLGIKADGSLWGCGYTGLGQLGVSTQYSVPTLIDAGPWERVVCGYFNSIGIKADGTLWATGNGGFGNGNAPGWGSTWTLADAGDDWGDARSIANASSHTWIVKADGTLWGAGSNSRSQFGNNFAYYAGFWKLSRRTDWVKVVGTIEQAAVIDESGALHVAGFNQYGLCDRGLNNTQSTTDWTRVGTETYLDVCHAASTLLAKRTDGTVWGWGANSQRQLDGTTTLRSSPVQVTAATNWHLSAHTYNGPPIVLREAT